MMRSDHAVVCDMLQEAQEEAVACQARADYCWAIGDDDRAEEHVAACATHQARSRVLSAHLARIDPERAPDPIQEPARAKSAASRPALTLHTNPGAPRG